MNIKKIIIAVSAAALLVIGVGAAAAQDGAPGRFGRGGEPGIMRQIVAVITEQTGMTAQEIVEQVRVEGATLASVIEANGGSVDETVAQVVAIITEQVNERLAAGEISAARAERQLTNLDAIVREALEGEGILGGLRDHFQDRLGGRGQGRGGRPGLPGLGGVAHFGTRPLISSAAEALNVLPADLVAQIRDGESLGAIIDTNGGDQAAIIADALALVDERLTQAVENGRITEEEKATLLSSVETRYTEFMSWTPANALAEGAV